MDKHILVVNLKAQIEERQKPLDTTQVQLDSVILFMEKLGYEPHSRPHANYVKGLCGFIRKENCLKEVNLAKCISFQDACRLHNGVMMRVVWLSWCDFLTIAGSLPLKIYSSACEAKLVERVYLQRKGKGVKCQQHWVKFVE